MHVSAGPNQGLGSSFLLLDCMIKPLALHDQASCKKDDSHRSTSQTEVPLAELLGASFLKKHWVSLCLFNPEAQAARQPLIWHPESSSSKGLSCSGGVLFFTDTGITVKDRMNELNQESIGPHCSLRCILSALPISHLPDPLS